MLNESAIHWIKEGLRVGKYPGSKWLAEKLGHSNTQEAQQILTEYKARVMAGELPGPGPVPPPPREGSGVKVFPVKRPTVQPEAPDVEKITEALLKHEPEQVPLPIVSEQVALTEEEKPKKGWLHWAKKKEVKTQDPPLAHDDPLHKEPLILKVIRQYALYVGMLIDLALGIVFFLAVSVDALTAAGMVAMAFIAVLFKVVAFVDGKKWLWAIFMSLTWWASVSFAVVTISSQATSVEAVVTQDSGELQRLQDKVEAAKNNLAAKNASADAVPTGYKSELDVRLKAVAQAEAQLATAESELRSFKAPAPVEKATVQKHTGINAENAFVIIPDVVMKGNLSQRISLVFFGLLFFGLEYTIAWSASPRKKRNG